MRMRDFYYSDGCGGAWGLILAAASGRSQNRQAGEPVPGDAGGSNDDCGSAEPLVPCLIRARRRCQRGPRAWSTGSSGYPGGIMMVRCRLLRPADRISRPLAVVESEERSFSKRRLGCCASTSWRMAGCRCRVGQGCVFGDGCKAADATRGDAKQLLSEIKLSVQAGMFPLRAIATPGLDRALADSDAAGGPKWRCRRTTGRCPFYGVDGKITARERTGRFRWQDCTRGSGYCGGEWPISFSGAGRKLRLHTE